jgi:hypothetical protein
MAGNWIKIEHITPDKPEIVAMAQALGIDQDSVFGKCIRVWIWADQQTISGTDLIVTPSLEVGWLKSRNGRFSLPHFDRHNGQTAKNRALSADRMQRQRYAQNVTESSPDQDLERDKEKKRKTKTILGAVDPGNLMPATPDPVTIPEVRKRLEKASKINLLGNPEAQFFDAARQAYPGTRGGLSAEWKNFESRYRAEIETILPLLLPAIEREKAHKAAQKAAGQFVPQWKNFPTWINQRCWEQEFAIVEAQNGKNGIGGGHPQPYESAQQRKDRRLREVMARLGDKAAGDRGVDHPALHLGAEGVAGG